MPAWGSSVSYYHSGALITRFTFVALTIYIHRQHPPAVLIHSSTIHQLFKPSLNLPSPSPLLPSPILYLTNHPVSSSIQHPPSFPTNTTETPERIFCALTCKPPFHLSFHSQQYSLPFVSCENFAYIVMALCFCPTPPSCLLPFAKGISQFHRT